ncbi:tyrosine-type recombinase/integrase, partial [Paraburkholderia aspalathi]|uniref:tyrosine-type recombinase/integrase n=1 Tax=Paraburkholderia aspalathi TaxID=1324617 RepID=UPI003555EFEC
PSAFTQIARVNALSRTFTTPLSAASHKLSGLLYDEVGYDTRTEITGHGFRAMARTILHEELEQKPEVIEHQLAHAVPDNLGSAYNRTKFIRERRVMMQLWADYLGKLKAGAQIIRIGGVAGGVGI